jgi:OmpA-OmpF porin, OOP family
MKKVYSLILACASFISLTSSTTFAETKANSITFTLGGGYYYFATKRDMDNTGIGFGGLGYNFTNHWGVEAILGGLNTHFKDSVNDDRSINGTLFSFDGVYHFSPFYRETFEPYLMAGVGVLGLNPNRNEANNEGNINAAAGLNLFIDKIIAFRVEARDFYTIVGGKNDVMLDGGVTVFWNLC